MAISEPVEPSPWNPDNGRLQRKQEQEAAGCMAANGSCWRKRQPDGDKAAVLFERSILDPVSPTGTGPPHRTTRMYSGIVQVGQDQTPCLKIAAKSVLVEPLWFYFKATC
jgi:hypothetical protein